MKPGDLVKFRYSSTITQPLEDRVGIWLSSRLTRWSEDHPFHKIITSEGIGEFILKDFELEVISEAG